MTRRKTMNVIHRASGETAIAIKSKDGCALVQFNRFDHPQSHGWHLYPRHQLIRRIDRVPADT